jgi:hypothetical protein
MAAHVRISRADGSSFEMGVKRLSHFGRVEAVADDGTVVDLSAAVCLTEIVLKPGDVEKVVVTFLAFEVES